MKLMKISSLLFMIMLAGCSPSMKNNVTRFHQLPEPNGAPIEVISMDPSLQRSIEFGTYAELVGRKLGEQGYTPPSGNVTTYVAEIAYNIRPLSETVIENRSPVSVGLGVGGGSRRGTSVGMGISTGFGSSEPQVEYISTFSMNIVRLSDGARVYEGRVENRGKNQNLPEIVPLLINSLFQDFPGQSGSSNTVTISPK